MGLLPSVNLQIFSVEKMRAIGHLRNSYITSIFVKWWSPNNCQKLVVALTIKGSLQIWSAQGSETETYRMCFDIYPCLSWHSGIVCVIYVYCPSGQIRKANSCLHPCENAEPLRCADGHSGAYFKHGRDQWIVSNVRRQENCLDLHDRCERSSSLRN